jgi:hypothetical protein
MAARRLPGLAQQHALFRGAGEPYQAKESVHQSALPVLRGGDHDGGATCATPHLPAPTRLAHAPGMFVVSEAEAAAIRTAFDQGGELSAAVELRRLFPGIADNENARRCARSIAGWTPQPPQPVKQRPVSRRPRPAA